MTVFLQNALELARLGWHIFPIAAMKKVPKISKQMGGRGCLDATTKFSQVGLWWANWPNCNIGLATGHGICVIDLDVKHEPINGKNAWIELCETIGRKDHWHTLMAHTPSGGIHLFYALKDGQELKNSAGKLGAGIDTRGKNGYVLLSPSVTDVGAYRWDMPLKPMAYLPNEIYKLLTKKKEYVPVIPKAPTGRDLSRYVQAALDKEIAGLTLAIDGQKHEMLRDSSFRLGTLIASPWADLGVDMVLSKLEQAVTMWAGRVESRKAASVTIHKALTAGMAVGPRPEPEGWGQKRKRPKRSGWDRHADDRAVPLEWAGQIDGQVVIVMDEKKPVWADTLFIKSKFPDSVWSDKMTQEIVSFSVPDHVFIVDYDDIEKGAVVANCLLDAGLTVKLYKE